MKAIKGYMPATSEGGHQCHRGCQTFPGLLQLFKHILLLQE